MQTLRKEDGFTLIETLSAMVILTIGILSYFTLQANMLRFNSRASTMTQASSLVASQLEILRQEPFTSTKLDSNPLNNPHSRVDAQTGYTIRWTVTDDVPVTGAKRIVASVTVPVPGGPTVSFDYVKFKEGL